MLALQRPHILDPPRILASRASSRLHTFRSSHAQYTPSTRAVITPAETGARRGIPMFAVRRRMLSYAHRFGSRRDQRGGQMGLRRQVRLQAQQRTPPHDAASPVDLQSRQVPVFTSHSHVEASASQRPVVGAGGRTARRLRVGLKAGPGAAARLEAGNCEEGFACLFQGIPYSRIRPALTVPYFSAASCSRQVCRNPYSIFSLFWILPPHSRLGGGIIIYRIQPFQT